MYPFTYISHYTDETIDKAPKMSLSKPKCQHLDRTLKEKIEILSKLDCGVKAVDLCKQFNIRSIHVVNMEETEN